jgi:hypothetical protein
MRHAAIWLVVGRAGADCSIVAHDSIGGRRQGRRHDAKEEPLVVEESHIQATFIITISYSSFIYFDILSNRMKIWLMYL